MSVIHTSMDLNGFEILDKTAHPPNFKLDSHVNKIPDDLYPEYHTYTGKQHTKNEIDLQ